MIKKFINSTEARLQSMETQIGQLAQTILEKPQGVPSNIDENRREQVQAVTLQVKKNLKKKKKMKDIQKRKKSKILKSKKKTMGYQ